MINSCFCVVIRQRQEFIFTYEICQNHVRHLNENNILFIDINLFFSTIHVQCTCTLYNVPSNCYMCNLFIWLCPYVVKVLQSKIIQIKEVQLLLLLQSINEWLKFCIFLFTASVLCQELVVTHAPKYVKFQDQKDKLPASDVPKVISHTLGVPMEVIIELAKSL